MPITYQEDEYTEEAEGLCCDRCGHSFQLGESAYDFGIFHDGYICADCVEAYVDEKFYFIPYPEVYPDEDKPFEEWRDNNPEEWDRQRARDHERWERMKENGEL